MRLFTGCFLYGVEVPANGGTTLGSLYQTYEELSNSMKNTIDALVGTFGYYARAGSVTKEDDNHDRARRIGKTPEVKHPPVNMNPVTGRPLHRPGTDVGMEGTPGRSQQPIGRATRTYGPTKYLRTRLADGRSGALGQCGRPPPYAFPNDKTAVKRMIIKLDQRNISFHRLPPETGFRNHLRPRTRVSVQQCLPQMHCCAATMPSRDRCSAPHLDQNAIQSHNTTAINQMERNMQLTKYKALTLTSSHSIGNRDGERRYALTNEVS